MPPKSSSSVLSSSFLRPTLFVFSIAFIIVILTGAGLNDLGHKYSKSLPHDHCHRELLILHVPHSQLCCDGPIHDSDWVCIAGFDRINRIMSSFWAYVLPIIPFIATLCTDLYVEGSFSKNIIVASLVRYILYFVVFIVRYGLLYHGGNVVQNSMQGVLFYGPHDEHNCWYSDWVHEQKCKDHFDFSDHIVMYLSNYMIPIVLELAVVLNRVYSQRGSFWSLLIHYLPTIISCLVLFVLSCRILFLTSMFFHTPAECFVAIVVAIFFVIVPVYFLDGSRYWSVACIGPKRIRSPESSE